MYIAPLRHAILHLAAGGAPFTFEAVSFIGRASMSQTRAYVSRLADRQVVLVTADDRIKRASKFVDWEQESPKTKPGGGRKINYRAVKEV